MEGNSKRHADKNSATNSPSLSNIGANNPSIHRPYVITVPVSSILPQSPVACIHHRKRALNPELGLGVGFTSASHDMESMPSISKPLDIRFNSGYNVRPRVGKGMMTPIEQVYINDSESGSDDDSSYPMPPPSPPKFGKSALPSNGISAQTSTLTTRSVTPVTERSAPERQLEAAATAAPSASASLASSLEDWELWQKLDERNRTTGDGTSAAISVASSSSNATMAPTPAGIQSPSVTPAVASTNLTQPTASIFNPLLPNSAIASTASTGFNSPIPSAGITQAPVPSHDPNNAQKVLDPWMLESIGVLERERRPYATQRDDSAMGSNVGSPSLLERERRPYSGTELLPVHGVIERERRPYSNSDDGTPPTQGDAQRRKIDSVDDSDIQENARKKAKGDGIAAESGDQNRPKSDFDLWTWVEAKPTDQTQPAPSTAGLPASAPASKPREGLTRQERIDWGLADSPTDSFSSMADDDWDRMFSDAPGKQPKDAPSLAGEPEKPADDHSATLNLLNVASASAAATAAAAVATPSGILVPVKRKVGRPPKNSPQAMATAARKAAEKAAAEKAAAERAAAGLPPIEVMGPPAPRAEKAPKLVDPSAPVKVKRPVGRPPKNLDARAAAIVAAAARANPPKAAVVPSASPVLPATTLVVDPKPQTKTKLASSMLSKTNEDMEIDEQEHRTMVQFYLTSEGVLLLSAMPHPWRWSPGIRAGELAWAEVPLSKKNGKSMLWPVQVLDRFVGRQAGGNPTMSIMKTVSSLSFDVTQPLLREIPENGKGLDLLNTVALNMTARSAKNKLTGRPVVAQSENQDGSLENRDDPMDGVSASVEPGTIEGSRGISVAPTPDVGTGGVATPSGAGVGLGLSNSTLEKLQQYHQQQLQVQKKQPGRPKTSYRNLLGTHVELQDPRFQIDSEIDVGYIIAPLPVKWEAKSATDAQPEIDGDTVLLPHVARCYYKKSMELLPFYLMNPECKEDIHWNVAVMHALDVCSSWAAPDALSDVLSPEKDGVWGEIVASLGAGAEAKRRNWGLQPIAPNTITERVRMIRDNVSAGDFVPTPELSFDERFLNVVRLGGERVQVGDLVRVTSRPIPAVGKVQRAVILAEEEPERGPYYNIPPTDGHEYLEITHIILRRPKTPALTPWRTGKEKAFGASPPYALRPAILLRGRIYYRLQACPQIGNISLWAPSCEVRTINALNWEMVSRVHPQFPSANLVLQFGYPGPTASGKDASSASVGIFGNAMVGGMVGRPREIPELEWDRDRKLDLGLGPTNRKDLTDIDRLLGLPERKRKRNERLRLRETASSWTYRPRRCQKDLGNASANSVACQKLPYTRELKAHFGCVNALAFSDNGQFLASGGDDSRVLLWPTLELNEHLSPAFSFTGHESNIFCIAFTSDPKIFYSCGNDGYLIRHRTDRPSSTLFSKEVQAPYVGGRAIKEVSSADEKIYAHDSAVLKLSVQPGNDDIVATAGQDGYIKLWDMRSHDKNTGCIFGFSGQNSVMFNPVLPEIIVSAADDGRILLHDLRMSFERASTSRVKFKPRTRHVMKYTTNLTCDRKWANNTSAISAVFSPCGQLIGTSLQRWRPTIYSVNDPAPIATLRSRVDGVRFNGKGDAGPTAGRVGCSSCCTVKTAAFSPDPSLAWCSRNTGKSKSTSDSTGENDEEFSDGAWKTDRLSWEKRSAVFAIGSDDFRAYGWAIPSVRELLDRRISYHPNDSTMLDKVRGKVSWFVPNGKMHIPVELCQEDFVLEGDKVSDINAKGTRVPNPRTRNRTRSVNLFDVFEGEEHMEEDTITLSDFDYLLISESAEDTLWGSNDTSSESSGEDRLSQSDENGSNSDEMDDGSESGDSSNQSDDSEEGVQPLLLAVWRRRASGGMVSSDQEEEAMDEDVAALRTQRRLSDRRRANRADPNEAAMMEEEEQRAAEAEALARDTTRRRQRRRLAEPSESSVSSNTCSWEDTDDAWDASVSPMPNPKTVIQRVNAEDSDDELERMFEMSENHLSSGSKRKPKPPEFIAEAE
ncbi:hypothetical protein HDU97_002198 [Phlyctochytrium planicorne]|nr:hypothetical protein HDU97_002198 [Phlyctochytrium planicorne]